MSRELNVDLAALRGTGPGGRITEDDVRAASTKTSSTADGSGSSWRPLPATRVALIRQMQRSLAEVPQIHLQRRLDVTPLMAKAQDVTFTHRLIFAVAAALRAHQPLRTRINGDQVKVEPVSVAVAIGLPHGLIAPVVRNVDRLSLEEVATAVRDLREKAQADGLRREELTDAPFALSNLGMYGVDLFDAFVFDGQTAVLSVGAAIDGPDGRKLAWIGLAVDHRVVDGAEAARFLQTLQAEILRQ